jgi:hypothetical protein
LESAKARLTSKLVSYQPQVRDQSRRRSVSNVRTIKICREENQSHHRGQIQVQLQQQLALRHGVNVQRAGVTCAIIIDGTFLVNGVDMCVVLGRQFWGAFNVHDGRSSIHEIFES